MPKDRSWVLLGDRRLAAYQNGCVEFMDFAFARCDVDNKIRCPCRDCKCRKWGDREFVHKHLLWRGWDKMYGQRRWTLHGESEEQYIGDEMNNTNHTEIPEVAISNEPVDVRDNMEDLLHACLHHDHHHDQEDLHEEPNPETDDFRTLIEEWCIPVYDGCRVYTKLSFVMEFYKIKSRGKMSDNTFTETLQLMRKLDFLNIPDSFYEVKKLIGKLGCGYVKIDACENDCMLFWKDDLNLNACKVCNASRWKNPVENQPSSSTSQRKRVPKKVLRHFPLIPRLKRLFICQKSAINMRWHAESRCNDGVLRHPADSDAWKEFDKKHESFSLDPRNVRLGLATDGFNPFGSLSSKHSTWPVILMVYNLPPNMCMQRSNMMMSLLISGPKGPKNGIDVYLQPLIDELNELWGSGITTFDAYTKHKKEGRVEGLWRAFKVTWKLPENEATKKWFNETANCRWKDAKTYYGWLDHRR
ncbi:PREDICTED: uncharacterized protein LOC105976822 [Erythranthe guttata]|uniref:uncharacterized protein LOC105976822 n=1 Tax=Erythranthe guttata TaxID=4155 RepID=UPI00064DD612|nr:PREDICTED: uncharacterized protein LOC105976822 [Erythranthe guttata]|eukprot:XP_012857535.1 PREDICTED: uncharacterized protein LOC105976822 [Erythranthe guttata]